MLTIADFRYQNGNTLQLVVAPGPKKISCMESYMAPILDQLKELEDGFEIVADDRTYFVKLRVIICGGDTPAVSAVYNFKGHTSSHPCRLCKVKGVKKPRTANPAKKKTVQKAT